MLKLVGSDGTQTYTWKLEPGKYVLGRGSQCDFRLTDKTVSRKHVEIEVGSGGQEIFVTDLGSHNGTAVNDQKIFSRTEVSTSDSLLFGSVEFRIISAGTNQITTPPTANLSEQDLEKSVVLPFSEALAPLPAKVTDLPDVLPTLFDMAKMLILPEPDEVLLNRSLELVAKVIPSERLAVLFTSDDGKNIYPAATILPEGKEVREFTLSRTIANEVLTEGNSVLICDSRLDSRYARQESIIASEMNSAMAVPLINEDEILGILYVDSSNPVHCYSDDYLRLLATFGNIVAARLANNLLLQQRQEKEVLEAEMTRAASIQKTLLDVAIPQIARYDLFAFQEPSRQVGGDLYDLIALDDGSLLFMVADVSGKGMGAALLMSNILAAFRILYYNKNFSLLSAVEQVSTQMYKYSRSGDFATLFIGVLRPDENEVRYVNAGHNSPLLVRTNGDIEYLEASGVMIGAFDFVGWKEETVKLNQGDLLYVFTDGVTEAQAADDEMYSDERTEEIVVEARGKSARDIAAVVVGDIKEFVQDAPSSDDITMLILKRDE